MKKLVVLLMGCVACLQASSEWRADIAYRRDNFKWSIGVNEINVLSELKWRDLDTVEGRLRYQWYSPCRYTLFADGGIGYIGDGHSQDSDWFLPNRNPAGEFSRTFSDVEGYLGDISVGVGLVYRPGCWTWIPNLGMSYRGMHLRDKGLRDASLFDPAPDLPSGVTVATYSPTYWTGFVGLDLRRCGRRGEWRLIGQFHWGLYKGYGDWKLRDDFDDFIDIAAAYGFVGRIERVWCWTPCLRAVVGIGGAYWGTSRGVQMTRGNDPEFGKFALAAIFRKAHWTTLTVNFGLMYSY